jgi:hypothetical protein
MVLNYNVVSISHLHAPYMPVHTALLHIIKLTHGAEPFLRSRQLCSYSQEFPSILRNPKVHFRVHMSPPLAPILIQIIPVHTTPSYLSKIHFNIVHPPTPWSHIIKTTQKSNFQNQPRPGHWLSCMGVFVGPLRECRDSITTVSFHILSNSSFTIIRRHRITLNVVK